MGILTPTEQSKDIWKTIVPGLMAEKHITFYSSKISLNPTSQKFWALIIFENFLVVHHQNGSLSSYSERKHKTMSIF